MRDRTVTMLETGFHTHINHRLPRVPARFGSLQGLDPSAI